MTSLLLVSRQPDLLARFDSELHAADAQHARELMARCQLVVLDLDVARSWDLLEESPRPVLAVASDPDELVRALDAGAEDAVLRDTAGEELEARIRAIQRRHQPARRVRIESGRAFLDGRPLALSSKEFEVLRVLVGLPGRSFTRDELLRAIWGEAGVETRRLDLVVSKLRRKLREPLIHSVWGIGYRYEE